MVYKICVIIDKQMVLPVVVSARNIQPAYVLLRIQIQADRLCYVVFIEQLHHNIQLPVQT